MVEIPLLTALDATLPEAAVGFEVVRDTGLLTNKQILRIQLELAQNNAGFRKLPGTALMTASVPIHNAPLYGILSGAR